ncbi:MAG: enoyl-CoA hydratase/isomerase family protein [Oceanospirillaceae bacterium]|nr:enoyl-CoA hydratase/isomerase family protein [Oceanospirillaceae bacterium]
MNNFENIILEQIESQVYCLTINRPKVLNALNQQTITELQAAIQIVATDASARVLLVTGSGEKAFVAGADIKQMQALAPLEAKAFSEQALATFRRLEMLDIPVIGLVNGFALGGGCELAMSCDFIFASENAKFGQPEVSLGVTAGFGGSQRLPRLVGRAMAMEMLVSGRMLDAQEAKQRGLVNHVYPQAELLEQGLKMAKKIIKNGPVAVKLTKELVQRGQDLDLENACAMESNLFGLCFATDEQSEGMSAFLDKRSAKF